MATTNIAMSDQLGFLPTFASGVRAQVSVCPQRNVQKCNKPAAYRFILCS
jgi:hypothetical protein